MTFQIETQKRKLWCWAACASSIGHFFDPQSTWTQCTVATGVFPQFNCCANATPCDQATSLKDALEVVGHFRLRHDRALTFDEIQDEHRAGFPVGARIEWAKGGGHFVILHATDFTSDGEPLVLVADPLFLDAPWPYDLFKTSYNDAQRTGKGGTWTHSYLVKQ